MWTMDLYYISQFFAYKFSLLGAENWSGLIFYVMPILLFQRHFFCFCVLFFYASNLKWLICNSPGVVSTCRLWESRCQRGSFSPAITLCYQGQHLPLQDNNKAPGGLEVWAGQHYYVLAWPLTVPGWNCCCSFEFMEGQNSWMMVNTALKYHNFFPGKQESS